jgi:hypothetical protein
MIELIPSILLNPYKAASMSYYDDDEPTEKKDHGFSNEMKK